MGDRAQYILVVGGSDWNQEGVGDNRLDWGPMNRAAVEAWYKATFPVRHPFLAKDDKPAIKRAALVRRFLEVAQPGQLVLLSTGSMLIRVVDSMGDAQSPENCLNFGYDHWTGQMIDYTVETVE